MMDQKLLKGEQKEHTSTQIYTDARFDDVFPGTDLPEAMYFFYSTVYFYISAVMYCFLALLPGTLLLFGYSILVGIVRFVIIWILNPVFFIATMLLKVLEVFKQNALNCLVRPYFRVVGTLFSGIVVRSQSVPQDRPVHIV